MAPKDQPEVMYRVLTDFLETNMLHSEVKKAELPAGEPEKPSSETDSEAEQNTTSDEKDT